MPAHEMLDEHDATVPLRFIMCGSVDDGKSTLIGRLLYEANQVFDDHLLKLAADSKKVGTRGDELDFALLVDGLAAEREQGITIDVAYRQFSTPRRRFVVADAPGHEQYTRNMVTGASTAEVAVVLVDARHGVQVQTRRHSYLASLLGIRNMVLAVNKMDLVDFSPAVFDSIDAEFRAVAAHTGLTEIMSIPLSALDGDNIVQRGTRMPWYDGPTLIQHLEDVEVDDRVEGCAFRLPVQRVKRSTADFRGFAGRIVGGSVQPGDSVCVAPSGQLSTVKRIVTADGDLEVAVAGQSVTVVLADEVDVSRGDIIASTEAPPAVADQFEAVIIWMDDHEMLPGRPYRMKIGTSTVGISIAAPKHRIDVNTLEHAAARTLLINEIGVCNINLDRPIPFDPYETNRETGGFIIIDRISNATIGAGMLHFALRRSDNVRWQTIDVAKRARAGMKGQQPTVVWFTGLSGAGKSTIANIVERKLHERGQHTCLLDGDNVRHGLNKDLGFTDADRVENIRRVAEVAALMVDAGLIVLVSFISPFQAERQMARDLVDDGEFIEVFVDTSLDVAEGRDPKGLYRKARAGKLANFTGIDSPYERPERPELVLKTADVSADSAADQVIEALLQHGRLR